MKYLLHTVSSKAEACKECGRPALDLVGELSVNDPVSVIVIERPEEGGNHVIGAVAPRKVPVVGRWTGEFLDVDKGVKNPNNGRAFDVQEVHADGMVFVRAAWKKG